MDLGAIIMLAAGVALWFAIDRWILPNRRRIGRSEYPIPPESVIPRRRSPANSRCFPVQGCGIDYERDVNRWSGRGVR